MPINSSLFISGSVGAGGRNKREDVSAVQQRLNALMHAPRQPLTVDGLSGSKTTRMIRDFQKNVVGFRRGDGRVDPDGKTIRALSDPGSEGAWAQMSIPPQDELRPRRGPGAGLSEPECDKHEKLHIAIANEIEDQDYAQELLDTALKDYGTAIKGMIATLGSAGDFLAIASAIKVFKDAGLTAPQAAQVIGVLLRNKSAPLSVALLREMGKNGKTLAPKLRSLGRGAFVLGIIVTTIECYGYWTRGEYGAAAGEIYKFGMGVAIPWASLLDAVQSIIEAMAPNLKGNAYLEGMFRILRTLNPLAAGGVAVDSVVTLMQTAITGLSTGQVNWSDLNKLVDRMKDGPLGVFADMGEALGDAAFDLHQWLAS
jgi:hypothetical protein